MTLGSQAAGPRAGHGPAPDPDCSVVIVNYYSEALLRACLESLPSSADPLSLEVIVVDNSGTARASGVLDAWPERAADRGRRATSASRGPAISAWPPRGDAISCC